MAEANLNLAPESAVTLYKAGRYSEAAAVCRVHVNSYPNDVDVLQILAMALSRLGVGEESTAIFRRIVALNPGSAEARNNLGRSLRLAGDTNGAIESYRHAIAMRPGLTEAVNGLADCLKEEGRPAESLGVWRDAPWLRPPFLGTDERIAESNAAGLAYNMAMRRVLGETRVNCVIDVGANEGQFGRHVRALGYSHRIISVEPASAPFRVLADVAGRDGKWSVLRLAAGRETGEAVLNLFPESVYNSLRPGSSNGPAVTDAHAATESETVEVRPLDELWDQLVGPIPSPKILLKIDTQGFDTEVLAGAASRIIPASVALQIEVSLRPMYSGVEPWWTPIQTLLTSGWGVAGLYPVARLQSDYTAIDLDCLMTRVVQSG